MRVLRVALLGVLPLAIDGKGLNGAPAGDFDSFVFAMAWEPQWVAGDCGSEVAEHLSPDAYAATHLSAHGLWPNYDGRDYEYPQFCEKYTACEGSGPPAWCGPSKETLSAFNTTARWQEYAQEYAWNELAQHEWSKHGSCTGLAQKDYFSEVEALLRKVGGGAGADLLRKSVGGEVPWEDLRSAFQSDLAGRRVSLRCSSCYLSEVWAAFAVDKATHRPTEPRDTGDKDSCERCGGAVKVRAFKACDPDGGKGACEPGRRGPPCDYSEGTAGTDADPCRAYADCLRCAKAEHGGKHYCTGAAAFAAVS